MILIGIISRNRAAVLPLSLDSALRQEQVNPIVAVYDNNSTDGTHLLIERYPSVEWTMSPENKGYLWARNHLMSREGLDFFVSLDDDSWFIESSTLYDAVQMLRNDATIGCIAFDILSPDETVSKPRINTEVADFIGCGHVLRISAVREAGFYEKMPGYYGGEEKDLSIRLIDLGYRIVKMGGHHVWHDKTTIARDLEAQHRSGVCNDLVFFFRRSPLLILIPGLGYKVFSHLRFCFTYRKTNFKPATFKAFGDFLTLMFLFKLDRAPVSIRTFMKFRKLPSA